MNNFYNQNILIVGGAKGISRAIGLELGKKKSNIIVVDNYRENISEIERDIGNARGSAFGYLCDFTSRKDIEKVFKDIIKKHDRIDIIINGIFYPLNKNFIEMGTQEIEEIISADMMSSIYFSRLTLEDMMKNNKGILINILADQDDDGIMSGICSSGIYAFHHGVNNLMKKKKGLVSSIAVSGRINNPTADAVKIISAIEKGKSEIKLK